MDSLALDSSAIAKMSNAVYVPNENCMKMRQNTVLPPAVRLSLRHQIQKPDIFTDGFDLWYRFVARKLDALARARRSPQPAARR